MTGSRFAQLAAELRERIALGDYARSGALESEADLGRRHGVSRVTVRRALEQLRDEGLVTARKGSGWYVAAGAAFGQSLALGTFQHASSAVADAGVPLTRRVVEYGYRPLPPDTASALDVAAGAEALRVRTVRVAGAHPLDVVTEWVPLPVAAPVSRADAEQPGVWETLRRHGHGVTIVRQSIAAAAASESVAALLDVAAGTPVLLVRRLALRDEATPLALSDHRYLGHRFRLDVEFRGWPAADPPGLHIGGT
ncbi:GntR family transcriptional regulator [Virgisporangium aliadipatigenens]|uniref:GntR family transcriptional regulator n=1 Tax=Virgisporangium aliadipatigenens TaxID=741659 RepID=A0A8J3YF35_9ACTN|nr:GntR family transcriptional regulator [Virgisporangium aliadipatigenens]GIJ43846.1 GntR family transcriptional regulator [Virgisporangium aliadipatigenens]